MPERPDPRLSDSGDQTPVHEIKILGPWTNDDSQCVVIECTTCNLELIDTDESLSWSEAQDLVRAHVGSELFQ